MACLAVVHAAHQVSIDSRVRRFWASHRDLHIPSAFVSTMYLSACNRLWFYVCTMGRVL